MPLPMLVKSKAEQVATALDWLVAEATANASAAPAPKAAAPSPPFAAAVPPVAVPPVADVRAAPPMRAAAPGHVAAHKHAAPHRQVAAAGPCGQKLTRRGNVRVAQTKPMTQNEASARLLIEGLPLFLPPAALFIEDRDACKP
jgi:hypothetical protein